MVFERALVAFVENEFGNLRREKALEPAGALDLCQLIGYALLKRPIPLCEIGSLRGDLVVQTRVLDRQYRLGRECLQKIDRVPGKLA